MFKKLFLSIFLLSSTNIAMYADQEQLADLATKLEEACSRFQQNLPKEEQKQEIKKICEELKKLDPQYDFKELYRISFLNVLNIAPDIWEYLLDECGVPAKDILVDSFENFNTLLEFSATPNHWAIAVNNLQIMKQRSSLTEAENKKIAKFLHTQKLMSCKKTMNWKVEERLDAKYSPECIAMKKLEKTFKPQN